MINVKRLSELDVAGRRVFIRADLNVPQDDNGAITDDTRIRASVPAIRDALARVETMIQFASTSLPLRAIREQIASSVHVLVQQSRLSDGSRKVTAISEVVGIDETGEIELRPIFEFVRTGTGPGSERRRARGALWTKRVGHPLAR